MDVMLGIILQLVSLLSVLVKGNSEICIDWDFKNDIFTFICNVSKLDTGISIRNPSGKEVAYCLLPYPKPLCYSYNQNGTINQHLTTKETVYTVIGESRNTLNGEWTCVHGTQNTSVYVRVFGMHSPPHIKISGPKSVQKNQPFSILCTSTEDSIGPAAVFTVNNQMYTQIHGNSSGCFSSRENSVCSDSSCQCFANGRSFLITYKGSLIDGMATVSCIMEFKHFGKISNCAFVQILDFTGPEIKASADFPLIAGTDVDLTCSVISATHVIMIKWNCIDIYSEQESRFNLTTYISKLRYKVESKDQGRTCLCSANIQEFVASTSLDIDIITAPVLLVDASALCNTSDSVCLSCWIHGKLSRYGFERWMHMFNGIFIRFINGLVIGNKTTLIIESCNHEDNGEYICSAWNEDSNKVMWSNKSTNLFISSRPIVTKTDMIINGIKFMSVEFYSITKPSIPQWFSDNHQSIDNDSGYLCTFSDQIIVMKIYGTVLTCKGYISTTTILNNNSIHINKQYYVVLTNEFGETRKKFEIGQGRNVFQIVIILLSTASVGLLMLMVAITTILATRFRCNEERSSLRNIYYAAPGNSTERNTYADINSIYDEINENLMLDMGLEHQHREACDKDSDSSQINDYLQPV